MVRSIREGWIISIGAISGSNRMGSGRWMLIHHRHSAFDAFRSRDLLNLWAPTALQIGGTAVIRVYFSGNIIESRAMG